MAGADGKVYQTTTDEIPHRGYVLQLSILIRNIAAAKMAGKWSVNFFIDGRKLLPLEFKILPTYGTLFLLLSGFARKIT
jgi:hypothetical protein